MMRFENVYALLRDRMNKVNEAQTNMRTAENKMCEVEGIDNFADSLSVSYIQSLKDHGAVKPVKKNIEEIERKVAESRLATLWKEAQQLMAEPKIDAINKLIRDTGFQSGISDVEQPDLGEARLIAQVDFLGKIRIPGVHRELLDIARTQAALNKQALDLLEENLQTAEEKIANLSAEIKKLQTLLAEQTSMLEKAAAAPRDDLGIYKIYQDNAANIAEKHKSIKQLRKAVSTAKKALVDSLGFAVGFESKETNYGTRYDLIKKDYAERVDPLVKSVLSDVESLFSQLDNAHKAALLKFLKTFGKVEKEEKQCQAEMERFPDAGLSDLRKQCKELADACSDHMKMLHELTAYRAKVFDVTCRLSDETTLEELEAYQAEIESPCSKGVDVSKRLCASRGKTSTSFKPVDDQLQKCSEDIRKSTIYQRLDSSFVSSRREFALYALFQDSSPTLLLDARQKINEKIKIKKDERDNQLLAALDCIMKKYNITVLTNAARSVSMFDHDDEEKVSESASDVRAKAMCLAIVRAQRDKKDGEWLQVHQAVKHFFAGDTFQFQMTEEKLANLLKIVDTLELPAVSPSASTALVMRFASSP